MQAIPRWRNLLLLKNTIIQSTEVASTSNTQLAEFHSTRTGSQKWEKKWNSEVRAGQQPSKPYVRYKVRQKWADTKKALKDLFFNSGSTKFTFEDMQFCSNGGSLVMWSIVNLRKRNKGNFIRVCLGTRGAGWTNVGASGSRNTKNNPTLEAVLESDTSWYADEENPFHKKDRSKSSHAAYRAAKAQHRRMKRKSKKEKLYEEMDSSDNVFQTSFRHRGSAWSYWSARDFFNESSTTGFDWRQHSNMSYRRQQESDIESETQFDDDDCAECMYSQRKLLGLPTSGSLKIEDVKKAFHLSALRWHPDKQQGSSQAMAEEKFKLCVDAYKSLCNSLPTA